MFASMLECKVEEEELKQITDCPSGHPPFIRSNSRQLIYGFLLPFKWHIYQWQTLPDSAYPPSMLAMLEKDANGNKIPSPTLSFEHWTVGALQCALERELYKPAGERSPETARANANDMLDSRRLWVQHIPYVQEVRTFNKHGDYTLEFCVVISHAVNQPSSDVVQPIQKWLKEEWKLFTEPQVYLSPTSTNAYSPDEVCTARGRALRHSKRQQ